MTMTTCRSCGAAIFWAKTVRGRAMPVDALPCDDGNIVITLKGEGYREEARAMYLTREQLEPGAVTAKRYKSHHATCPHAAQWRKKGKVPA
jgi:hypothetical protein